MPRNLDEAGQYTIAPFPTNVDELDMSEHMDRLDLLRARVREFAAERDWEQFHNPKNLAMAVAGEAGELIEHFQWLTPEQADSLPPAAREEVALECADVLLFLLRLTDRLGIDLAAAAERKLVLNANKYPIAKSKGRATKYDKL
jgi:dCTP diphosphatase